MIKSSGNVIEIQPIIFNAFGTESLIIDLDERRIATIHSHGPRDKETIAMIKNYMQLYGASPNCVVIEIITTPTENSTSKKTLSHKLVYTDPNDYNMDYGRIRDHILNKTKF